MWKRAPKPALVPVALALALSACTAWGPGPDLAGATPNGVTIRYDAAKVVRENVDDKAQSYCRGFGKDAKLRQISAAKPEMTYADYACVAPKG